MVDQVIEQCKGKIQEYSMNAHEGELIIPKNAFKDPRAIELLRVWAAGGEQHVAIATGLWKDPAQWGIMLVDLARHVANFFEQTDGTAFQAALDRLKLGFDAEWDSPTDTPTGSVENEPS